jgi:hypothetical protein
VPDDSIVCLLLKKKWRHSHSFSEMKNARKEIIIIGNWEKWYSNNKSTCDDVVAFLSLSCAQLWFDRKRSIWSTRGFSSIINLHKSMVNTHSMCTTATIRLLIILFPFVFVNGRCFLLVMKQEERNWIRSR